MLLLATCVGTLSSQNVGRGKCHILWPPHSGRAGLIRIGPFLSHNNVSDSPYPCYISRVFLPGGIKESIFINEI